MKSLFIIRDKNTGAVCSSAKHCDFNADINEASLFNSAANAENAIRKIIYALANKVNPYGGNTWYITDGDKTTAYFYRFKQEYIEMLESKDHYAASWHNVEEVQFDLEVVEVKLTVV